MGGLSIFEHRIGMIFFDQKSQKMELLGRVFCEKSGKCKIENFSMLRQILKNQSQPNFFRVTPPLLKFF